MAWNAGVDRGYSRYMLMAHLDELTVVERGVGCQHAYLIMGRGG